MIFETIFLLAVSFWIISVHFGIIKCIALHSLRCVWEWYVRHVMKQTAQIIKLYVVFAYCLICFVWALRGSIKTAIVIYYKLNRFYANLIHYFIYKKVINLFVILNDIKEGYVRIKHYINGHELKYNKKGVYVSANYLIFFSHI